MLGFNALSEAPLSALPAASGAGAITGNASITFGALTLSSAGALAIKADAAVTLGALTTTSASAVAIKGSAAVTFESLSLAAEGTIVTAERTGAASITFDALTVTSAGALPIVASLAVTLGDMALEAAGDDGIPDAGGGGADGAGIRNVFKKPKRRVLKPEDVKVPKSVEQELEEYLDSLKAKPPRAKLNKPPAKLKAAVAELTDAEREAMAYWAEQQEIADEDEEIIMLLLAA